MKKETTVFSQKSIFIIGVAVFFAILIIVTIAVKSDFRVGSLRSVLKKKTVAPQIQNQSASFFKTLFASSGQTEIYKVQKDDKWVVVIDGQESALYDDVANPTFSLDGTQFAYSATIDGEEFVIMNNEQQGEAYFDIRQILFNSTGSTLAFLADTGNGSLVVVNGVEGKTYDIIGTLETELGITFLAFTTDDKIVYRPVEGQQTFIVVDTAEGKKYAEIKEIYFSTDGTHVAYYAQEGNNLLTIIDGKVTETQVITPVDPVVAPTTPRTTTPPVTTPSQKLNSKDSARNLSPDIDKQPDRLNPLICGQTTDCNF